MGKNWLSVIVVLLIVITLTGCRKNTKTVETTAATSSTQVEPDVPLLDRSGTETKPRAEDTPLVESEPTYPAKQNVGSSQTTPVQTKPTETKPLQTEPVQKETTAPETEKETVPPATTAPQPDVETVPPETTAPQPDTETTPSDSMNLGLGGLPLAPE